MKRTFLVATLVLGSSICSQSFGFDLLDRMLGLKGSGHHSSCCDTVACEPACGLESACGGCGACGDVCEPACGAEGPLGGIFGHHHQGGACGNACEPACGLESACGGCGACGDVCEPACGLEVAACDTGCCGGHGHGNNGGLLGRLFSGGLLGHHCNSGCDTACGCGDICEPACGLEGAYASDCGCGNACDTGCCGQSKRPHLLHRLFGHLHRDNCCDSGCDVYAGADCGCSSAPVMASPAPVVDQEAAPMPPAPAVDPSAHLQSKRRVIQASASYIR